MRSLFYFLKEAVRGLYQAKLMTSASIFSVAASLFFTSAVFLSLYNIQLILERTAGQPDVAAYLTDEISADITACKEIVKKIQNLEQVKAVTLISKDSVWVRFSQLYGHEMAESVDDNPLPATIEIFLKKQYQTTEGANALQQILKQFSGIEQVRYSREWITKIEEYRQIFWLVLIVFVVIMIVVLLFMVSNSVKLTIYARKELVRNMELVGATRFFITIPFIIEGILQGLLGGLICVAGLFIIRYFFPHILLSWRLEFFSVAILSLGVIFGWIGSMSAVRKFLA